MFEFRKFDNWFWFPKKVVATVKLKTRIKSEHNKLWNYFLLAIHPRHRRNAINMHMTGGEIFTCAKEVTEYFVSVENDDVSTVIDRYRSTFESSLGAF